MSAPASSQLRRFYRAFSDLVRAYQFRDRECSGRFGISVADWYPLELLVENGPLPMGVLAGILNLDVSTITRTIGRLEKRRAVVKRRSAEDGRVFLVQATPSGKSLVRKVQAALLDELKEVLHSIEPSARREVIRSFILLNDMLGRRSDDVSADAREGNPGRRRTTR